jgi:uncharacterized iron-regulated protein
MTRTLVALSVVAGLWAAPLAADDPALNLALGDPSRSGREAPLVLDAITDTRTGELLTPAELPERLADVSLLLVGESHLSMESHRVERRVIEELRESGREVMVGLEMYPYTQQDYLDQWGAGLLTEQGFVRLSRWYEYWGYHWEYYRDIFMYARERGVRMFAVNTPREVVRAVRMKGFENLTPEQAAHIPERIDTDSDDHRRLFRAFFGGEDAMHSSMTEEQWDGMFKAQCTWEATMGHNAIRSLEEHGGDDAIMVVLIGSGHVAYGLGVERQVALGFEGKTATLIPVNVVDEERAPATVRASYADFIWGLPAPRPPRFPVLGLSTRADKETGQLAVIHVQEDSVAASSGFELGDALLTLDGEPISGREDLKRLMAGKGWGDAGVFEVRRGDEALSLTAQFRRTPPEAAGEDES